ALKGERFDGNKFVDKALEKGASCAVCREFQMPLEDYPVALVDDELKALGEFASWYKRFLAYQVLAITGSCGKTTTKELIYSVVSQAFSAGATKGNLNNLIGLPLTMLSMAPGVEWAILEMGTNIPGEIERLCQIARPKIGVLTCVRPVHLEGLGSLENIGYEKGFLLQSLPEDGCAIVNVDDELVVKNIERTRARDVWGFGFGTTALEDVRLDHLVKVVEWQEGEGGLEVELDADGQVVKVDSRLRGRANVANIAAAYAAGMALGISHDLISLGIEACLPPKGRMNMERLAGWVIIDDSYNANPASMEAALEFFKGFTPALGKNLILGDMLELGQEAERYHLELGKKAASSGASVMVVVGSMAEVISRGAQEAGFPAGRIWKFASAQEAAEFLRQEDGIFFNGTRRVVLLKGSRGVRLEEVAEAVKDRLREGL
ncbi:MAG: UDP-N-acetylmuramoyl-tripeptide--D-alanyl-D-alanine ligase, partial [Thermodesulfobacteria bacterium]|nr:UDP-N-acetylmuramoyl-tripeptide--D-alanyl-D-alanine ligase [Thermodesulfobacteriota bacterium]